MKVKTEYDNNAQKTPPTNAWAIQPLYDQE